TRRVNSVRTVFSAQFVVGRRVLANSDAVCGALSQSASMTAHSESEIAGGDMRRSAYYTRSGLVNYICREEGIPRPAAPPEASTPSAAGPDCPHGRRTEYSARIIDMMCEPNRESG